MFSLHRKNSFVRSPFEQTDKSKFTMIIIFYPWEDYLARQLAFSLMYNMGEDRILPVDMPPRNDLLIKDAIKQAKLIIVLVVHPEAQFSKAQQKDLEQIKNKRVPIYLLIPENYKHIPEIVKKKKHIVIHTNLNTSPEQAIQTLQNLITQVWTKTESRTKTKKRTNATIQALIAILLVLIGLYMLVRISQQKDSP